MATCMFIVKHYRFWEILGSLRLFNNLKDNIYNAILEENRVRKNALLKFNLATLKIP